MTAFNTNITTSGVEIAGFTGFPIVKELIVSIDYRDNLVHLVYDPKHGVHANDAVKKDPGSPIY